MKIQLAFLPLLLLCLIKNVGYAQNIVSYSVPKELYYAAHNDDFTVRVRSIGGKWQDLYEYKVKVDADNVQEASMVNFDFAKPIELAITKNNGDIHSVKIRPLSHGIKSTLTDNTIHFVLNKPVNLSVEVNGDKLHNLHVFANPILENIPKATDKNVMYFGAGTHFPKDSTGKAFIIPSNTTVYIDGGAVLKGKLVCNKVENVKIYGRGIIDNPQRGIEIMHAKNIEVDGIVVRNPEHYTVYGGESQGIIIKNIKSFSHKGWGDGIDLMSCSNVLIDGVFLRTSDDCIAIYAHRWNFYGNAKNILVKNSTLWADIAHPTNIGLHGNAEKGWAGDTIENVTLRNIDILEHDEDDRNYQGCLSINASDNNLVRNLLYEDIRIEKFQEGQVFNLRVYFNEKYSAAAGRGIQHVKFKNITYQGNLDNPSLLQGFNATRKVEDIVFENVKINGNLILNPVAGNIVIGQHVKDVQFIKSEVKR
ncbi:hypothetical protein ABID42_002906 [Arcicella rosea]|uniref:glycosyl hydrolase family 28 protein n=1 Tax=Arcicella rosea TaxID=502909 RepID=UPI00345E05E9